VWTDDDLEPGQRWERELEQLITEETGLFILCLSANLQQRLSGRTYVLKELEHAANTASRISANRTWLVPVVLTPCDADEIARGVAKVRLRDFHAARLDQDWTKGMQRLVAAIRRALDLPTPLPIHPLGTEGSRTALVPCRFRVEELYDRSGRWTERGDVEVRLVGEGGTQRASLIPSGRVGREIRHTRVLDPARKQALTSEFLRGHGTEELDGFRFANARASPPQVYSSAYDEFLIFSS